MTQEKPEVDLRLVATPRVKRPYARPELKPLGAVSALTKGPVGSVLDGGGFHKHTP